MQARRFKDDDYLALKSAVRRSRKVAGPRDAIAEQTRVGSTQIANYEDPRQADCHIPIDVAMDLDELAGEDVILAQWAALRGYYLKPAQAAPSGKAIHEHAGPMCKEFGEAIAAMGGGSHSPRCRENIINELRDVLSVINAAISDLHSEDVQARAVA